MKELFWSVHLHESIFQTSYKHINLTDINIGVRRRRLAIANRFTQAHKRPTIL